MTELRESYDSLGDVEAMLQAASGYVRASDDLRPRVLETARAQRCEQRAQRCVRRVAVFALLVAGFTAPADRALAPAEGRRPTGWFLADSKTFEMQVEAKAAPAGGVAWGTVEAFTELRERQAEALHSAL